ncbi:MAG: glycosyltransferase family 4 protein [Syntrophobacteraceae bacterium]
MSPHTPLRILWISERYPPLTGGMAVSALRQVQGLRRRGLPVDVIAFTETDPRALVSTVPRDGGVDYHLSRSPRRGLTAQRAWRLASLAHAGSPYTSVVGFGAGMPGYLAVTFAAWLGCPSLVLVRGNDFDQDWFEPHRSHWVREALSRASVVGVVSHDMIRRIRALFPEADVRFIPNGVDLAGLEQLPRDETVCLEIRSQLTVDGRCIIGLFGELKYKKGVPFWLGAIREAGLMDRMALLVVGKWVDEEARIILSDPALAPPSVHVPFSNRKRLPGFYKACDFVALPSHFDGMPNVLLEAMALGVVPIVSDAGAMGEIVEDGRTGFVFRADDRRGAAEATAKALGLDAAGRAAMAKRASESVFERFSLERESDALCEILLPNRSGP